MKKKAWFVMLAIIILLVFFIFMLYPMSANKANEFTHTCGENHEWVCFPTKGAISTEICGCFMNDTGG